MGKDSMKGKEIFIVRRVIIGLFILAVGLMPLVTKSQYYVTVGNFIGIYAIVAMGLALLLGYAGQVSMAQAAFFGIGGYTSAIMTTTTACNPWIAVVGRVDVHAPTRMLSAITENIYERSRAWNRKRKPPTMPRNRRPWSE